MTDAEKVVKALRAACIEVPRGDDWHQPEGAAGALADFVEAAVRVRTPPRTCGARDHSCANCAIDKRAQDAALARLAEVLNGA